MNNENEVTTAAKVDNMIDENCERQQQQQQSVLSKSNDEVRPTTPLPTTGTCDTPPSGILTIPTDMECLVSMDDITGENYVEYQIYPTFEWKSAKISQPIIQHLQRTQFDAYIDRVQSSDCQAELKRLLLQGPPIYVSDPYGLPLFDGNNSGNENQITNPASSAITMQQSSQSQEEEETYIMNLWFASDQIIHSAKLHNAVVGEDHIRLWNELKSYLILDTNATTTTTTNNNNDNDDK